MEKSVMEKPYRQYRLVFKGELLAGSDPVGVRSRASQRLGASPAQIERLFSGQIVTLKRGLSIDAAARYARELRLLGMRMHVELDATALPKADLAAGQCKIVFSGELAAGFVREQVMAAASERLHASTAQIALLFSGRKTTLKKGLNDEQARRYASRLQNIGMLVAVESPESAVPEAPEARTPAAPAPDVPASEQNASFSHVETLVHSPLMQASESLQAEPVELDFTQTMVDHELIATNAQQVLPDMEKTELAGEGVLRAYMYDVQPADVPDAAAAVPPPPAFSQVFQAAASAAPLAAATEFVQAANVAPTAPMRICISCGARQTHGRHCAHCGHEFPREFAPREAQLPAVQAASATLLQTVLVSEPSATSARQGRPNRILYAALATALVSLTFAAWRLFR